MILITKIEQQEFNQKLFQNTLNRNLSNKSITNIVVFTNTNYISNNRKIIVINELPVESVCIEKVIKLFSNQILCWSFWNIIFNGQLSRFDKIENTETFYQNDFIIFNSKNFIKKYSNIFDCLIGKKIDISTESISQKILLSNNEKDNTSQDSVKIKGKKYEAPSEFLNVKKIDVIIVSVNYNDTLTLSIINNMRFLKNITVVTSCSDIRCQEICQILNVKCITTDKMFENGDSFNKGKAINEGIKSIEEPEWILLLDADIILTEEIKLEQLEKNTIYTSDRFICRDNKTYDRWKNGQIGISQIGEYEKDNHYGYFQLFNINSNKINNKKIYSESYSHAAISDTDFSGLFEKREKITTCVHLGRIAKNWKGRKTEPFITDDLLNQILDEKKFNVNKYFDRIYCINLDRRQDRWNKVSKEFIRLGIDVERFSAIDGQHLDFLPEKGLNIEVLSKKGLLENSNALGCLMSHLEIIKTSKSKGLSKILILEDDVIFQEDFIQKVKSVKEFNWKLFYLGASQFNWSDIKVENGFYKCRNTLGTFAYAIDCSIYDEVIELLEQKKLSVDNYLAIIQEKYNNECFTFFPNIVISDVTSSEIRKSKEISDYATKVKWNLTFFEKKLESSKKLEDLTSQGYIESISSSKEHSEKNTVLFLINLNDTGGAEYVSYQHIKVCRELGYNVKIVSVGKGMFFEKTKLLDVDLYHAKLDTIIKDKIYEILEVMTENVDIVYNCNYFGISNYIHKIKKIKEFKYYTIAHSDIEWVIDEIYNHDKITDKYIVIHDKIRNELNRKGVCNTRIYTVPNFVEFDKIIKRFESFDNTNLKSELGISENDFIIGMTTRISPDKNILDSIKILSRLDNKSKLLIVGDAPNQPESTSYKNQVLEEIKNFDLQDRVIITGHVENEEVVKYLSLFDISLNNSPSEGLPISLLEQMSVGIHCVYPSHGEIPIVLENCGSIIEMKQRKSFHGSSGDDYIFSRFKDYEIDNFVNEINKIISEDGRISSKKIIERIKYQRNSESIKYYLDFLFGGYKDGVSFIIRARNEVINIEDCIKSINDIADEIIYVDHLSTDGTYEKALELSHVYDNLKVFRYDREIPKPGPNYQKNILNIGNSISQYYNFCLSKATRKTIFKWDADFIANRINLKEMIDEYSLRTRDDKFSMWFTGETVFIKNEKKYINKNSYYDEYRGFSLFKGVKWSDAVRCEYVDRGYADSSIPLRFEKPCFYEIKRVDINEFEHREGLIDKRDIQDYEIIQNLINNQIVENLVEVDNLNEKIVLTYGTFDTFHFGHLEILRRAKDLGQKLIVGLSTDEFNTKKNKKSKFNFKHRKQWIESIKYVDLVIPEKNWQQKIEDVRKYNVDVLVMGDDWKGKFDDLPCKVIYLPRTENISSTEIKKII